MKALRLLLVVLELALVACVHNAPVEPGVVVTNTEKGACLALEAVTDDGTVEKFCATADKLAPLVAPLIEALIAEGEPEAATEQPRAVAMKVTATRKVHRRRKKDGGTDGAIADAGP